MSSVASKNLTANLPITALAGVGVVVADKLSELGITRLFDLVMHLPRGFEDKSRIIPLSDVVHGSVCLVQGYIVSAEKKNGLNVVIEDGTGRLSIKFFKSWKALEEAMMVGEQVTFFGEIKVSRFGVQMAHPEYYVGKFQLEQGLLPIYPSVKGLHQNKIRQLIRLALQTLSHGGLYGLPNDLLLSVVPSHYHYLLSNDHNPLLSALYALHLPSANADIFAQTALLEQIKGRTHPACQRLILEELVAHQLVFMYRKKNLHRHKAPICAKTSPLAEQLLVNLSFSPTCAQQRVVSEIVNDLTKSNPMLRLVQGDVGAGKTLVAGLSACHALDGGWQVAIMAPTEILAEQHYLNFKNWFEPLGIGVGKLLGKQTQKERNQNLIGLINNDIQIAVGTHALFSDGVSFAKLGLVIIDEQHRFGVEQRLKLANKGIAGATPHQLAMTATPIPRTLAMSMYGDMDLSIIDELPPGRTPITTVMVNRNRREEVLSRILVNCQAGKQAYWVCPLVEESETLDAQSAELMYQEICEQLPLQVGLIHGKMKASDKQATMIAFKEGRLDLLVATTVIEVGVDVPNASLMVIENAERLGLSQLHQLRGRVGRGTEQSFCVLMYQSPLSEVGIERLMVLRDSTDGFVIAKKDLELRGAGELLGKRQTGDMGYYVADIVRDEELLGIANLLAEHLMTMPNHQALGELMMGLWLRQAREYVNA